MKIYQVGGNDCGGFQKPKGHMDSQMFPECEGTETDRDIVKKTRERKNKKKKKKVHAQAESIGDVWNLETSEEEFAAHMLSQLVDKAINGDVIQQQYLSSLWDGESWDSIKEKVLVEGSTWYVWWMDGVRTFSSQLNTVDAAVADDRENSVIDSDSEGEDAFLPDASANACKTCKIVEAKRKKKKKKKRGTNPWAVCHTTVDKDKAPEKFERCVKKVKKQKSFNLNSFVKESNTGMLMNEIKSNWDNYQILQAIKALGEESIAGFGQVSPEDVPEVLAMSEEYVLGEIKDWLSSNVG